MRFYNTGKCKFTKTDKGEAADLAVPDQEPGTAIVYGRAVAAKQFVDLPDNLIAADVLREHPALVLEKDAPAPVPAKPASPAKAAKE